MVATPSWYEAPALALWKQISRVVSAALACGSSAAASSAVDLPPSSASEKGLHCARSSGVLNWKSSRELSPKGPRRTAASSAGRHQVGRRRHGTADSSSSDQAACSCLYIQRRVQQHAPRSMNSSVLRRSRLKSAMVLGGLSS